MRVNKNTWKELNTGFFLRKECTPIVKSGDIQRAGNELIMKIARNLNIPILLTLDAHFVNKEQKIVQDLLLQNGRTEEKGLKFYTKYYQMNTQDAWSKWMQVHGTDYSSQFVEAVESNHALASMCDRISLQKEYRLPEVNFPREIIEVSSNFDERCKQYAIELINKHERLKDDSRYVDRLKKEISIIANNGKINLLPYFFALHDICESARQLNIWIGAGRGSAGGCLLAYLLKITHIDPIKYNLSFERFLSSGRINRGKLPDIDIDFSEPDKVAEFLKAKYGDKFARICTTGTNKIKSAIRDVSRVILDTKNDEDAKLYVDNVCKTISNVPQGFSDLNKWLHGWEDDEGAHPGELGTNKALSDFFKEHPAVQELVEQVLGIPKSLGRHASAYCLADIPLSEIVPICTINEEDCTQFTMEAVEAMGLVKFDLLGLNTLKDIGNCVKLIKERHGIDIDIYSIEEDQKVFKEFSDGKTETIFQFNGAVPTNVCKLIKPQSILDLASITAACRPGTMYAEMEDEEGKSTLINIWVKRRQSDKPFSFLHDSLKDTLSTTHGIVLFQEQISEMFQKSCNYTAEQADEIREIIGKKKMDQMNKILPDIKRRLGDNGWNIQQINAFVSLCRSSSNYAFNLSHSVAYSYMAYVCMWLKSYYPLEWWTAILQNSSHEDLEKHAKYFSAVVKKPDVNVSAIDFYIIDDSDQKIVYPLTMIKGVKTASEEIFNNKPYTSFEDFYNRVNKKIVNKRVVSALIWSGALDSIYKGDSEDIAEIRNSLNFEYHQLRGEKAPEKIATTKAEMLQSKSLCIGSPDIVEFFQQKGKKGCKDIPSVMLITAGTQVCTAGIITRFKKIKTKKNDEMCFIDISNKEHEISLTCFPEMYESISDKIKEEKAVLVNGTVNVYNSRKSIIVDAIKFFDIDDLVHATTDDIKLNSVTKREVVLVAEDLIKARECGWARNRASRENNLSDDCFLTEDPKERIKTDMSGAAGECGCAKELGLEWLAHVNNFIDPDIYGKNGEPIEVRTAIKPDSHLLLLRENDYSSKRRIQRFYIMVTVHPDSVPLWEKFITGEYIVQPEDKIRLIIHGYIWGEDGLKDKWFGSPNGDSRPEAQCYQVPVNSLKDVSLFINT